MHKTSIATMGALRPHNTGKMQKRETCLQLGLLSSLIESAQIYFRVCTSLVGLFSQKVMM